MKNKKGISMMLLIVIITLVAVITTIIVYAIMGSNFVAKLSEEQAKIDNASLNISDNTIAPSEVEYTKALSIFNSITKIYEPMQSPFDDEKVLELVMTKIGANNQNPDYSEENVNKVLHEMFGPDAVINKEKLTDSQDALYYFSTTENKYRVRPMGKEFVINDQYLKSVKQTSSEYFVEAYIIQGQVELNENNEASLTFKDKEGNSITELLSDSWDNKSKIFEKYKNKLSVIRYTLEKSNDSYYILKTELE